MGKTQDPIDHLKASAAWFALYVRHRHEKSVAKGISEKGLTVFLPLYKIAHRWKDRMKDLVLPLFPNYVFILAAPGQRSMVLSTPGIYDFVRLSGVPAPIPSEEIEAVRQAVAHGLNAEPHPFLKSGDRVRVKTGPLGGMEGILVRKKNFYRLVLSVELLVRSISVEVDVADVERVDGDRSSMVAGNFPASAAIRDYR
jgi:transcription antitermination factor NusG